MASTEYFKETLDENNLSADTNQLFINVHNVYYRVF